MTGGGAVALHPAFVGAGAVEGRNGDVQQAEVRPGEKLAAVVDRVVEHEAAQHRDAGKANRVLPSLLPLQITAKSASAAAAMASRAVATP